jgi:hypothetical protein
MSDEEEREEVERKHRKAKELYESLQEEKARPSESPPPARESASSGAPPDIPQTTAGDTKVYTEKPTYEGEDSRRERVKPTYEGGDSRRARVKTTRHGIAEPPAKEKQEHHQYAPHGQDTSHVSQMAHDSTFWQKEQTEPTPSYTRLSQTRKAHRDPRTEGTPIDSPFFQPHTSESITQRILEAPRRIKEKAEQIGYRAEQKYEQVRGKPVSIAAQKLYDARSAENDLKFHRGEISETIHRARNAQYEKARATSSVPLEKRLVGDINNLGQGGMIRNVADTFVRGAVGERTPAERRAGAAPVSVLEKIDSTYRASPQPRFSAGKGTKQTSPTKGTVVSNVKKGIDFGRTGFLGAGLSTQSPAFSMNTPLFSQPPSPREEEELRKRKKPRRGR